MYTNTYRKGKCFLGTSGIKLTDKFVFQNPGEVKSRCVFVGLCYRDCIEVRTVDKRW